MKKQIIALTIMFVASATTIEAYTFQLNGVCYNVSQNKKNLINKLISDMQRGFPNAQNELQQILQGKQSLCRSNIDVFTVSQTLQIN